LLGAICETIVRKGGYRFAWTGLVEQDAAHTIRPAKWAGESGGYLGRRFSWDEQGAESSPEGAAVRLRRPMVFNSIAAEPEAPWKNAALKAGFAAILAYPLMAPEREVTGVLVLCSENLHAFTDTEVTLFSELAADLGYGLEALRSAAARNEAERRAVEYHERLSRSMRRTVEALAATIEKRDPYTAGHQRRTADLAAAIARRMALSEEEREGIAVGGLVHDIGKISVPAEILNRPGPLSTFERDVVRTHAAVGQEIIGGIEFPWPVEEMVHSHHERLDGSGYPRGLKGEEIGTAARIIAVADVVEAMCSHRPHRPARSIEAALKEIRDHAGVLYDENVVDACEALFREGYRFPG
jgi:putative nucleotidyltransferase with HDIG domain